MRRALQIITFVLMVGFGLQACAVAVGGDLASELSSGSFNQQEADDLAAAGGLGLAAAFLWLLAGAFIMSRPVLSALFFFVAGGICVGASLTESPYEDLAVWGVASAVLTALALWPAQNELEREQAADPHVQGGGRDQRIEAIAKLAELRDSGALTEEEFAQEKSRVLRGD